MGREETKNGNDLNQFTVVNSKGYDTYSNMASIKQTYKKKKEEGKSIDNGRR